ncbi:ABC transporter ATP-binding protein [Cohnella sp.]|uniref:ABC transporter ATP-binding protein n=1 Tax=Cohnella sp. TaxID=1883426 RepID=UPI003567B7AC
MLKVEGVSKTYKQGLWPKQTRKQALDDVTLVWRAGESIGIIGESGSGKSTLGRLILGIERPDRGTVTLNGEPTARAASRRGKLSAVFQDYTSSMNPFHTVEQVLMEPVELMGLQDDSGGNGRRVARDNRRKKLTRMLEQVGLDASFLSRYPHELSGGQAQRVCIARALITKPACMLLDEAISALDGTVQMQVLHLLASLRADYDLGYIFITHDIQAAVFLCDRLAVIRNGRIVEHIEVARLGEAKEPYVRELLEKTLG